MTLISTARVGRTQLHVPILGLGAAPLGGAPFKPISDTEAVETVRYALANGVTFFDTAPQYGAGLSERRLGMALAGVPRDSYVLATKVGRLVTPEGRVTIDFSREGILRSVEASLERLQIGRIDILHIHDPDRHYRAALDVVFPVLAELRSQGVIQAVGAGMNQWQMLADFARHADFDCFMLAGRYTLLEQDSLELLSLCQARPISIFLGGVYNSGILATGARPGAKYNYYDAPPAILERVRRIEDICARYVVPLNVVALQFPLAHPAITSVVVGTGSAARITVTLQALQTPIPSGLWADLKAEGLLHEAAPVPQ